MLKLLSDHEVHRLSLQVYQQNIKNDHEKRIAQMVPLLLNLLNLGPFTLDILLAFVDFEINHAVCCDFCFLLSCKRNGGGGGKNTFETSHSRRTQIQGNKTCDMQEIKNV